jgi:hypothetical protein
MGKHTTTRRFRRWSCIAAALLAGSALMPARAAVIGVLDDTRQSAYLSLLGNSSAAARLALTTDGHQLVAISSLAPAVLNALDILWLPLLDSTKGYTAQERTNITEFAANGGSVIWIGDADVFNTADNSFLSAFGVAKLAGNMNLGLTPAMQTHPVISGPHGVVTLLGTNAGYGVFDGAANAAIANAFVANPGPGTFAGFLDPSSGYAGSGRVAFICDASIFGQLLDNDSHRTFLRNVVKWAAYAPSYTPAGAPVGTSGITGACPACSTVQVTFSTVTATGETTVRPIGTGRCYFNGIPYAALPANFLGYAFAIETTAAYPAQSSIDITVTYDAAVLTSLGITDESALRLLRYDETAQTTIDIGTGLDTTANKITGSTGRLGSFLLGAVVAAADCNNNGLPDVCEISQTSTAPGGPFYCTANCVADCNNNGVPDTCDLVAGTSQDCDDNDIPDDCQPDILLTIATDPTIGGTTTPNGVRNYRPCATASISAQASDGYCFSGWTVSTGSPPADPAAMQTNVAADVNKMVVAHFKGVITQQPADATVCEGLPGTFAVQVHSDFSPTAQFQWRLNGSPLTDGEPITGATTPTLQINPVTPEQAGIYTCVVTHGCGSTITTPATLTVNLLPAITADPADQAVCPGSSATFQISATGTGLTYRWQFDDEDGFADLDNGANVSGAASNILTLDQITTPMAGEYRCVVTGTCGTPVTGMSATLTVHEIAQVGAGPVDQSACPGETRTFTITATGTDLTYQWQFNPGGGFVILQEDSGVSGVATTSITIADIAATDAGAYRCVVFGRCGTPVTSTAATLTVGAFLQVVGHPTDHFACPGDAVAFAVSVTGTGRTYQWQHDGGVGFVNLQDDENVTGTTGTTLSIAHADTASAGAYRCVVSGNCGEPVASQAAMLTVGEAVILNTGPVGQALCPGGSAAFQVSATGTNLTYLWQVNHGAAFESLADDGNITGATTASVAIAHVTSQHAGQYRCIVFGGCGPAVTSSAATLLVSSGLCDCNGNGVPDNQDIANGTSLDCNNNAIPDDCDLTAGTSHDCNSNGIPDECDIAASTSHDCNHNGIPDECDLAAGTSHDCNSNGIPDECDIAASTSYDCNHNGFPDECDPPYLADAGDPFRMCVGVTSPLMGGPAVATGSNPPYTYLWQIVSGPADGGTILTPTAERPRFSAGLPGDYVIRLQVSDSSQPPCIATDEVTITAVQVTVDAGVPFAMCLGTTSAALTPVIGGSGTPPLSCEWIIETGSPDLSLGQFTGSGPHSASPTFTPGAAGTYTIHVSVADSGDPSCIAADTLTVQVADLAIDATDDFAMCAGAVSAPLNVTIVSRGIDPLSYSWTIDSGSPDTALSQFGGAGSASSNPTFHPTIAGVYSLRVTVTDSATPPCERSTVVHVTAGNLTVEAGAVQTTCLGAGGIRLSPSIQGGFAQLNITWSIDPGSPDTSPTQFHDPHQNAAAPLFVPAQAGDYLLRLTVTDSASPPCAATDTIVVHVSAVAANAGTDFTMPAFQPSQPLGATPLATGGVPPYSYKWEVVGGVDRNPAQFSATNIEHPVFTPAAVGPYELKVTVTSTNGAGCAGADTLALEAIATTLTLPVNTEGRLFMTLQIDAPHTRADVRLSEAAPGANVQGVLRDDGAAANFDGQIALPDLSRRLRVTSDLAAGSFIAVVAMYYDESELAGSSERSLRIHWLSEPQNSWRTPGTEPLEDGPYPARPSRSDLGRQGVDRVNHCVWVVLDYLGEFSPGIPSGDNAAGADLTNSQTPGTTGSGSGPAGLPASAMCGTTGSCGAGAILPLGFALLAAAPRGRRRAARASRFE